MTKKRTHRAEIAAYTRDFALRQADQKSIERATRALYRLWRDCRLEYIEYQEGGVEIAITIGRRARTGPIEPEEGPEADAEPGAPAVPCQDNPEQDALEVAPGVRVPPAFTLH